ncbi:MurR/RpiR family transcriptional regulator [Companilactobacillus sp.]|jgi:DNA-binding MurR/RpiR family transcriptional regulator|uniref:MurR/RpiR family transcriptional regulator n=1 Tax=Companilactobacillus sp. TaxID=2767905 RepID=UPI0025C6624A|nr:MurR/RpiR family transcriptional regulator [Companilactobacillus sp.]MCH4008991.1 MurR/RpiR family transcriptional regulator [Companilactobacillus sp.]MCH4050830.1 MurR/RpiR family transcriptional regulator [Companilactobacillus sp.]MCH4076934.1 MurR/RpiR family transcriptional regulator [Companilactobacillus sp.]MCH4125509.1 MurR/RpiR family transcriptional regulator [Companilactobacillus sp.]MCI1311218.1 MurR/RpiR family transcriptional regulator [Companilactobacillus sp.]
MAKNINYVIQSYYHNLKGTYKEIADYILHTESFDSALTISSLAEEVNVSISSISRFAKILGFSSFQDFKLSLITSSSDSSDSLFQDITANDSYMTMTQKIFNGNISTLKATEKVLTERQLEQASTIIEESDCVAFFGLGASGIVAQDGFHKFLRSDKKPYFTTDFHMQLMMATKLTEKDCAIVISHSGENQDTLQIVSELRKNHVKIIGITSYGNSSLTHLVDVCLLSISDETQYQNEALHAIIAQISLVDTLFMITAVHDEQQTSTVFKEIRSTINLTRKTAEKK